MVCVPHARVNSFELLKHHMINNCAFPLARVRHVRDTKPVHWNTYLSTGLTFFHYYPCFKRSFYYMERENMCSMLQFRAHIFFKCIPYDFSQVTGFGDLFFRQKSTVAITRHELFFLYSVIYSPYRKVH